MDYKEMEQHMEAGTRRRMEEIIDMERNSSPMTDAFRQPAYAGTSLCPERKKDENNIDHKLKGRMWEDHYSGSHGRDSGGKTRKESDSAGQ